MTDVMVLAAGLGTRLSELTAECPKPLVQLGDAPLLEQILRRARAQGFASAVINTHHHPRAFADFASGLPPEQQLRLSHEPQLLGTAGGVRRVKDIFGMPRVLWNGDIYVNPPLHALLERTRTAEVCFLVAPTTGAGSVGLDAAGNVVRLRGERFGVEHSAADYLGVMAFSQSQGLQFPEVGCLIADVCLPLLRAGGRVTSLLHEAPWFDVGTLHGYRAANEHWLAEHGYESFASEGAVVGAEVRLARCVLGRGAKVSGTGELSGCIVFAGAAATAPLHDVVVLPSGRRVPLPSASP